MTVIFSKRCELGLQAVLLLASCDDGITENSKSISARLQAPKEFISKILQDLTGKGIVGSRKGKNGGFFLAKKPNEIFLYDIIEAIDGLSVFQACVIGFPGCSNDNPCPLHNTWGMLREETRTMLQKQSLEDLKEMTLRKIQSMQC